MSAHDNYDAERESLAAGTTRVEFQWRLVFAFLIGAGGVLAIVGNTTILARRIFGSNIIPWDDVPWRFQIWEIELRLVAMLVGGALIAAAVHLSRGRWKWSLFVAILAIIVAIKNPAINGALRHHFAGDSYTLEAPTGELTVVTIGLPDTAPSLGAPELLNAPFDESTAKKKQDEWANYLKREPTERNSIAMNMVLIPAGSFLLGSIESPLELEKTFPIIEINNRDPSFKYAFDSERPPHTVRITKAFYMSKCNVTLAQFRQFVNDTGHKTEAEADGKGAWGYTEGENPALAKKTSFNWHTTGFAQGDDSPVVNVSWNDAMSFCDWLSKKERKTYRLPTDAEWEYGCRAGTITRYSIGDNPDDLLAVGNVADVSYFTLLLGGSLPPPDARDRARAMGMMVNGDDRYAFTSPIGKFKPNAFGLFDMHGNASTWCIDEYSTNHSSHSEVDNPRGSSAGSTRVVRGGNWQFYPAFCRSASRFACAPSRRELYLGLRVVLEL